MSDEHLTQYKCPACNVGTLERLISEVEDGSMRAYLSCKGCSLTAEATILPDRVRLISGHEDLEPVYAELNARLHEQVYSPVFQAKLINGAGE